MTPFDVNERDASGMTPLHHCCRCNDLDGAKALLSSRAGASAVLADNNGVAPGNLPGCTIGRAVNRIAAETNATGKEALCQPDYTNWATLDTWQLKQFLVPFLLPNAFLFLCAYRGHTLLAMVGLMMALGGFMAVGAYAQGQRRRSMATAGWFTGALVAGSYLLVTKVFPAYAEGSGGGLVLAPYLWYISTALMTYHYAKAVFADPGVVRSTPGDRKEILSKVAALGEERAVTEHHIDLTSMVLKPLRSKHCTKVGQCIQRFDHFCVWTGNTIAAGNHRSFVLYCLCQVVSQLCVLFVTAHVMFFGYAVEQSGASFPIFDVISWEQWLWSNLPAPTATTTTSKPTWALEDNAAITIYLVCYNTLVTFMVSMMAFMQLWYASRNVTSNEVWFADRYEWMILIETRAVSYFDHGASANLKEFFFSGPKGLLHASMTRVLPPMPENVRYRLSELERKKANGYVKRDTGAGFFGEMIDQSMKPSSSSRPGVMDAKAMKAADRLATERRFLAFL